MKLLVISDTNAINLEDLRTYDVIGNEIEIDCGKEYEFEFKNDISAIAFGKILTDALIYHTTIQDNNFVIDMREDYKELKSEDGAEDSWEI